MNEGSEDDWTTDSQETPYLVHAVSIRWGHETKSRDWIYETYVLERKSVRGIKYSIRLGGLTTIEYLKREQIHNICKESRKR